MGGGGGRLGVAGLSQQPYNPTLWPFSHVCSFYDSHFWTCPSAFGGSLATLLRPHQQVTSILGYRS